MDTTNIWVADCEVFAHDNVIVAESISNAEVKTWINDNYGFHCWIDSNTPILCGFNSKHYDAYIQKLIYNNGTPEEVKELSDWIIEKNADGERNKEPWNHPYIAYKRFPADTVDLRSDSPQGLSLKQIEGELRLPIVESSVPFDIDRPLTESEINEVVDYCRYDVKATVRLFHERLAYLQAKANLGAMFNLPLGKALHMSNAQLSAAYLQARQPDEPRADEFTFETPPNLRIEKYKQTLEFFSVIDPTYKSKLTLDLAGVPHVIAYGGIHGAIPNYQESTTATRIILHVDVASYYPSLIVRNKLLSRNVPDPDEYERVFNKRLAAKKAKDTATANSLKLVLNTVFGAMKSPYNGLYDPKMANAVCLSGQLFLVDLIEKIEGIQTLRLIQSNTDGLIVSIESGWRYKLDSAIAEWERRTGFEMGTDMIDRIAQKDVNNYAYISNGEVEVKGAYAANANGGSYRNGSLVVVAKALVEFLLNDIPIETTIQNCQDILDFQIISKAGSSYERVVWGGREVQMVNRVYASKNNSGSDADPGIYKIKRNPDGSERIEKIGNTPECCIIDNNNEATIDQIDRDWYIKLAQKRVNDYLGIKPEKKKRNPNTPAPRKRESKSKSTARTGGDDITGGEPISKRRKKTNMAKSSKAETMEGMQDVQELQPTREVADQTAINETAGAGMLSFYAKLFKLQKLMSEFDWEKDGHNKYQNYHYISEAQYKAYYKRALVEVGLIWEMETVEYKVNPMPGNDKMHLITTVHLGRLIDPDTGKERSYMFLGSGQDNGDKALYKSITGALKYFLASTFLVAEYNDPERESAPVQQTRPATPEQREATRETVTNASEQPTSEQAESMRLGMEMLQKTGAPQEIIDKAKHYIAQIKTREAAAKMIETLGQLIQSASEAAHAD